jgi:hypothetical protein
MPEASIDYRGRVPQKVRFPALFDVSVCADETSGGDVSKLMSPNKTPSSRRNLAFWQSTLRSPGYLDRQREDSEWRPRMAIGIAIL